MKRNTLFSAIILSVAILINSPTSAQVAIRETGTAGPDPSAMLEIVSTDKGILIPRVTDATAISSPAEGLLVYQTGAPAGFYYYTPTPTPKWNLITAGGITTETDPIVKAINGIVQSDGTTISSATSGTDYSAGTSALATGIVKSTTGTGALSIAVPVDFPTLNQNTTGTASNVTGIVAIANGGTNGSTALNNNRIMVSLTGAIVEANALLNGQLLIGSTGAAPVVANLSTTGNSLRITNTAGGINISANVANASLTTNVTTTSNVLSNVTGLSFAIGAGETWSFEFNLQTGCNNTGGIRYALTFPTGTLRATVVGMGNATTAVASSVLVTSGTAPAIAFNAIASTLGWTRITGSIRGTNAGTIQLRFRSNTNGQTSTIYADSYLTARRH